MRGALFQEQRSERMGSREMGDSATPPNSAVESRNPANDAVETLLMPAVLAVLASKDLMTRSWTSIAGPVGGFSPIQPTFALPQLAQAVSSSATD